ncbi:DUF4384 domain-containing protein [Parasedimentitalea maritima]|uniref:DUF4384 domain-containing protein n=1 Tax=Parasedimentitalea maritima TaxID=2578117 RepID=UPI00131BFEF8|nr:DUF4384 domain-containing protein [Zongyanglinia marina]
MRPRPGIWAGGILGSALAHLGFAALLLWSLRPDTVENQPSPQSELQLQAYRIPRSEAVPQAPTADPAAQADTQGEGLATGEIPKSTASSMVPQSDQIEPARPTSTTLNAARDPAPQATPLAPTPETLPPAPSPSDQVVATAPAVTPLVVSEAMVAGVTAAATPEVSLTKAVPLPVLQSSTIAQPSPVPLAQSTTAADAAPILAPDAQPLDNTQPTSTQSLQQTPDATALTEHPPAPVTATLSKPDVPRIKAALAFSGDGAGQADPVSLAAFQSFMQPGDVSAAGDPLRDGVSGILAAVPCSRLQVVFDPETATLNLRGHLPETGLRAPVLAALQAQMGADIQVSDQMKILPRPQCGALAGISNVGLPQSTDQITNPRLIGADTHARVLDYVGGDRLFFDLTAPDYDAYVYVDYFDAGGDVLHLSPNAAAPLSLTPAQNRLRVGAKAASDPGLQITVGPPYGQEIAVAFAASHPLYSELRPISEQAAPYLVWLSERVSEARAAHADFKGEWVYFFVSTTTQ